MIRKIALLTAGIMAFTLAGCGSGSESSSAAAQGGSQTSVAASSTAAETSSKGDGKTYRLIYTNPLVGHEFMDAISEGAEKAAEDLGGVIQVETIGPTSYNESEFVKDFNSAAASKPDGIIGYGISEELCKKPINDAVAAGIPVITVDCDTPQSDRLAYVGTGQYEAGYKAGETMIEMTGGNATIAVLTAALDSESVNARIEGFQDAIKDQEGMEIVVTESGVEVLEATEKASQLILAYPEVNAFFCPSQNPLFGCATMLTEKGLGDKYTVIGFDTSDEIFAAIESGVIDATTVQQPYEMGYQVVEMFYQLLVEGKEPEQEINTVEVVMCTKDNLADFMK